MAKGGLDRWATRVANAAALWGLLPPTAVGVVIAYFASSAAWVAEWGPAGWLGAGVAAFLATGAGMALTARAKLWRLDARHHARLSADSSLFDPMAKVYENKRLFLRDLAPLGRREVRGKTFINCEIIGPGSIVVWLRSKENMPFPLMKDTTMYDVDCIQVRPGFDSKLSVVFPDCNFENCAFYHLNLLFFNWVDNPTWNWITLPPNQTLLPSLGGLPDDEKPG